MLFMCDVAVALPAGYMALTSVDSSSRFIEAVTPPAIMFWQYGYEFAFIAFGIAIGVAGGLLITMAVSCCTYWPSGQPSCHSGLST
jgi:hypothetical protein